MWLIKFKKILHFVLMFVCLQAGAGLERGGEGGVRVLSSVSVVKLARTVSDDGQYLCLTKVSEDCLFLNIFVPRSVDFSEPVRRPLPVMVWIHGGDFIAGSASKPIYDGRFISNFTNTVVVNLEYRLGKKVFYSNTHLFCFNMKFFFIFWKDKPIYLY